MFNFGAILAKYPELLAGAWQTLFLSSVSILIGFVFGHLLCFGKMSERPVIRRICALYISFFRGTPLLVQLSIVFYFLPLAGINIPSALAAVLCLSMNTAAFQAEILRGGFQALPKGQVEAAVDLGFSPLQIRLHVQEPQVFRATLPALLNETIDILKNSALISTIAVTDLMRVSQTIASSTYRPVEAFAVAGAIYFIMTFAIGKFGLYLERRLRLP